MKFENQYSALDQWLHRFSFSTSSAQIGISDLEDRLYANQISKEEPKKPVFVTALPRAGTTILLNLLVETGEFASHLYRDMPFVLCPMIWQKFSAHFNREAQHRERAHGDGLSISVDSPEALEEMVWMPFWQGHYQEDRIKPWHGCKNEQFQAFFHNHMRKIIALRFPEQPGQFRYVSKNNMNVARLAGLPRLFPDCTIVVPFREPIQHAASLLNQHRAFLEMHKADNFSKRYMAGTGHFDFGANLKPISFGNWLDNARHTDPLTLAFWLEYWIATYQNVISQKNSAIHIVSFESLTQNPLQILGKLSEILGLTNPASLKAQAPQLRPAPEHAVDLSGVPEKLLQYARQTEATLQTRALSSFPSISASV